MGTADTAYKEKIKRRDQSEKQRRAAYQKKIDTEMKDMIKCRVMNLEDPGKNVSIEFTYEGHSFAFYDGQEYDIPRIVVRHLNNVKTPIHQMIQDPTAPKDVVAIIKKIAGFKHRFSVVPVELGV